MRIDLISDIHLEFAPVTINNTNGAKVLLMAGDICVAEDLRNIDPTGIIQSKKAEYLLNFFHNINNQYDHVLWIMGNHEHYHGDFMTTQLIINKFLHDYGLNNIHLLDDDPYKIDDFIFIGGTMWTNMNNQDDLTMLHIRDMMNDFRVIKNSRTAVQYKVYNEILEREEYRDRVGNFTPKDSIDEFYKFNKLMEHIVLNGGHKYVIMTHHCPTFHSIDERYTNDKLMNGAYATDLSEYIMDHPQIKLWVHGHVHVDKDYMCGETRVVCHPRGYGERESPQYKDYEPKLIEV